MCRKHGAGAPSSTIFSPGNLDGAARAGACGARRSAVDDQLLSHMQATPSPARGRPASGCWSASARIRARPSLVRYAERLADRLRAPWVALHVETLRTAPAQRGRAGPHRRGAARLAEQLGGDAMVTLPGGAGASPTRSLAYAAAPTTSPTSSSASRRSRAGASCCRARWSHDLVRRAGDISVHVIAGAAANGDERPAGRRPADSRRASSRGPTAAASLVVGSGARRRHGARARSLDVSNVALVFLVAVLVAGAVRFGLWPALFAGIVARARLQLLLPAAALHLHHRRPRERRGAGSSSACAVDRQPT